MFDYMFLLGRPGCGKSVVYDRLVERLRQEGLGEDFMRIDDFPILREIVKRDKDFKRHVPSEGEFHITDLSVYDDVLREINRRLKGLRRPGRVVSVEFARGSYSQALKFFDDEVMTRSLIVYIYCPFDICINRIERRSKGFSPEALDAHMVPRKKMEELYRADDYEELFLKSEGELRKASPARIVAVKNDADGLEGLRGELEKVVAACKQG